jgi:hypothetical protein
MAVAVVVVSAGCGSSGTTYTAPAVAPTPAPRTPAAPVNDTVQRTVSGRVLDENGGPVANAGVSADSFDVAAGHYSFMAPVLTVGNGYYQTVVITLPAGIVTLVKITAGGFEETDTDAPYDVPQDLRLFRPLVLTPGVDVHLQIDGSNSQRGPSYDPWSCHPVHVTVPLGKRVTVTTLADDPAHSVYLVNDGPTLLNATYPYLNSLTLPATGVDQVFQLLSGPTPVSFAVRMTVQ